MLYEVITILVTSSKDANGRSMPEPGAGGVSYLNTFGFGQTAYYSPIFVYYDNLESPAAVADAASHEMGHTIGLTHDGTTASGSPGKGGNRNVSWSPIMGLDHAGHLTQWSRGDYRGATNTVITSYSIHYTKLYELPAGNDFYKGRQVV